MEKILAQIEKYTLYAVVFLLPFTVLSISPNPFSEPKLVLLAFGLSLILIIRCIRIITSGKMEFSVGTFDFPVFLIAFAYILSSILATPNKMEAYLLPGTTSAIVAGVLLYFLINQLKEAEKRTLILLLTISAAIFSLITMMSFSGIMDSIPQLPAYIKSRGFTPDGGFLPAIIFLLTVLPLSIGEFISSKVQLNKIITAVSGVLILFGLLVSAYNLIPGKPYSPQFPSFNTSWQISIEVLKQSPILGVGPGNYMTAFNRFRPLSFNASNLWALKFSTARAFYFTALTETGLLGLAGLILLLVSLYRQIRKDIKEQKLVKWGFAATSSIISIVLLAVAFALFPATILLLILFFIVLSLNTKARHTSLNLSSESASEMAHTAGEIATQKVASRFPALLLTIPVMIVVVLFLVQSVKVVRAEYKFKTALDKLVANDAQATYDTIVEAINLNPRVDRYHSTFARINLALANSLVQRLTTPDDKGVTPEVTDNDRQNITALIQQAIAQGKATVALNPYRSGNWEVLAQVYRAIMPLAQGSDQFAIQSYRQAVALDPINPNLRIALGGTYYAIGDYNNAVQSFQYAVAAKNDLANAHYNLAVAYSQNGNLDNAITEMTTVLSLIPKDSQDYDVARKALQDLQDKKQTAAQAGKELNPPQEGEQVLEPPVELPAGSEPPEAPLTPTPTPSPSSLTPSPGTGTPSPGTTGTITPSLAP